MQIAPIQSAQHMPTAAMQPSAINGSLPAPVSQESLSSAAAKQPSAINGATDSVSISAEARSLSMQALGGADEPPEELQKLQEVVQQNRTVKKALNMYDRIEQTTQEMLDIESEYSESDQQSDGVDSVNPVENMLFLRRAVDG